MGYEVLSDDLYEDKDFNEKPKKKGHKKSKETSEKSSFQFNPMYLHITILILVLIGIIYFFTSDFSLSTKDVQDKQVTIVGDISNFEKNFSGDIELYSTEFKLETTTSNFDDAAKDFFIKGFNGTIYLKNNSIILNGIAEKIDFGKNLIKLQNTRFLLESKKKTNLNLFFDEISLNVSEGRIILGDTLNYEFINSRIDLLNYNASVSYDGVFSFIGTTSKFNLNNMQDNLNIVFKNK